MATELKSVWVGSSSSPTPLYKQIISATTLKDNSYRVQAALIFDSPGRKTVSFDADGIGYTSLTADIRAQNVGTPYTFWFTYPKARDFAGTHVITLYPPEAVEDERAKFQIPFAISAPVGPTEAELAESISPIYNDLMEWMFQQRALAVMNVDVNGKPAVRDRWTPPGGIDVSGDKPIRIDSIWLGKSQPWPVINGQRAPREWVVTTPFYLQAVVDGMPGPFTKKWDQGFDFNNVEGRTVTIEAGLIPPGKHTVALRLGLAIEGLTNFFSVSPPFILNVSAAPVPEIPRVVPNLAVLVGKLDGILPGSAFALPVTVTCDGSPVEGNTAAMFIEGIKVASDTVVGGAVTLKAAAPSTATPGKTLRGTVTVSGTDTCKGGETTFAIPIAARGGRSIKILVPKAVVEGQAVSIEALVGCSTGASEGEPVTFTIDGKKITVVDSAGGRASTTWLAEGTRSHKIGASVPRTDVCAGDDAAFSTESINVITSRAASQMEPTKFALLAQQPTAELAQLVQLGTPEELLPSVISLLKFPTLTGLPELVPTTGLPQQPEITIPTQGYGTIVIPEINIPMKYQDTPMRILIDGIPVGAPPASQQVAAGTHTVRVEVRGLTPIEKRVTVGAGETQTLSGLSMM